jgi:hypothetical protein
MIGIIDVIELVFYYVCSPPIQIYRSMFRRILFGSCFYSFYYKVLQVLSPNRRKISWKQSGQQHHVLKNLDTVSLYS